MRELGAPWLQLVLERCGEHKISQTRRILKVAKIGTVEGVFLRMEEKRYGLSYPHIHLENHPKDRSPTLISSGLIC